MSPCPVCGFSATQKFFEQRGVPVREGYLAPSREQAIACDVGDIVLGFCPECTHVWNDQFDAEKLAFDPQYDVSMFHSASYRAYIAMAIERLKLRYNLQGKVALEIACGKGDFLRMLIDHGFSKAIGFDPTFEDKNLSDEDRRRIVAYRAFYDEAASHIKVDLVACRSALQYFRYPRTFLESLRRTLQDQHSTVVYFEVPNGEETFGRQIVWNIAYEHGCFYSPSSVRRLFAECGFEVLDVLPGLGGSQLEIEARISTSASISRRPAVDASNAMDAIKGFSSIRAERVASWSRRLGDWATAGKKVVLWGAGARAISFLCAVENANVVAAAVDINPARQGRFLPRSGVEVISPARLPSLEPALVIATNPNFAAEIRNQLNELGVYCEFDVLA